MPPDPVAAEPDVLHERAVGWYVESARLRADVLREGEGWISVHDPLHPYSHDGNRLVVHSRPAEPLPGLVERETAPLSPRHRAVTCYFGLPAADVLALQHEGFVREDLVVITASVANLVPREHSVPVARVTEPEAAVFAAEYWRTERPEMADHVVAELVDRRSVDPRSATIELLAVLDGTHIVASADLATRDGVTELDGVATLPAYRQLGYGDALLSETIRYAARVGSDLLLLEALADDWPRTWYAARGFVEVALAQSFVRVIDA